MHPEFSKPLALGKGAINNALRAAVIQRALGYSNETEEAFQSGVKLIVKERDDLISSSLRHHDAPVRTIGADHGAPDEQVQPKLLNHRNSSSGRGTILRPFSSRTYRLASQLPPAPIFSGDAMEGEACHRKRVHPAMAQANADTARALGGTQTAKPWDAQCVQKRAFVPHATVLVALARMSARSKGPKPRKPAANVIGAAVMVGNIAIENKAGIGLNSSLRLCTF